MMHAAPFDLSRSDRFTFPESWALPEASPDVGEDAGPPLDILVVDDHGTVRRALELSLGHLGHLVVSAGTLGDALGLLRSIRVDVVLCDILLPDGDGVELLERWPDGVRRVPVVAISGVNDVTLPHRCTRVGFEAFLAKPLAIEDLRRAIRRATRRGR